MIERKTEDTFVITVPRMEVVYDRNDLTVTVTASTLENLYHSMREVLLYGEDKG